MYRIKSSIFVILSVIGSLLLVNVCLVDAAPIQWPDYGYGYGPGPYWLEGPDFVEYPEVYLPPYYPAPFDPIEYYPADVVPLYPVDSGPLYPVDPWYPF